MAAPSTPVSLVLNTPPSSVSSSPRDGPDLVTLSGSASPSKGQDVGSRSILNGKPPRLENQRTELIKVIVESNCGKSAEYMVFKSFLRHYSKYFDEALNDSVAEGQTQTVTIQDFDFPEAFGHVMSWMYTQSTENWLSTSEGAYAIADNLTHVWMLADLLAIPDLQNQVVHLLIKLGNFGANATVTWMCLKTQESIRIRCLISRVLVCGLESGEKPREMLKRLHIDTVLDIAVLLAQKVDPRISAIKAEDFMVKLD